MARNGSPEDPNNYSDSEPTQYANLGGTSGHAYSEYDQPTYPSGQHFSDPEPPTPWQRKPAVLIGLGMATVLVAGLLIFAIVKFTSSDSHSPASTTTTAPSASISTTSAPATTANTTETVTVSPTQTSAAPTTPTTTSEAPSSTTTTTTTEPPTTTSTTTSTAPSTTVSTSTSTVTETVTTRVRPTIPWLPSQGEDDQ